MEIVKFPKANLSEVATELRNLADSIDAGTHGEITTAFVILPNNEDWPAIFGYGTVEGDRHPVVQLELAKAWLVNNITRRA